MSPPIAQEAPQHEPRTGRPERRWFGSVIIALPQGTVRHPRLLDVVEKEIGRPCAIDVGDAGISLGVGLDGVNRAEAETDCDTLVERVLGRLTLTPDAVCNTYIAEFEDEAPDAEPRPPDLRPSPATR